MRAYSELEIRRLAAQERQATIDWMRRRSPREQNPRRFLHPQFAVERLGYRYEERGDLDLELRLVGTQKVRKRAPCSGLLDRNNRLVAVSERSSPQERRFSAGHELGHLVLHPDMEAAHRDRPVRPDERLPPREREANSFSACYTMPQKWVINDVKTKFGQVPIVVTEDWIWHLDPADYERFYEVRFKDELAMALATCSNRGGDHFLSMKDEYDVSAEAMAKRLQELSLICNRLTVGLGS